jgi:ABC-type amino acid transport substrate-binding protein
MDVEFSGMRRFCAGTAGWACALTLVAGASLLTPQCANAGPVAERVKAAKAVRVCIWPEYYGITYRNPRNQQLDGIDIDLSNEYARDIGVRLEYVESSFARLMPDLLDDRCDVAMFAVGITAQRQLSLKFTQPYLQSDIYGMTTRASRNIRTWDDIDKPGIQVAVQAGTFMEPVMAAALKQAKLVVIRPPLTREQELESGRVDVFMTDYPYSRRLMASADWVRLVSPPKPFNLIPYAYAVKPGDPDWLAQVDQFVSRIKADGRLDKAAKKYGLSDILVAK